jgi:glucuronate isomerase
MKRRYLDAVMETAGLYNTAGFNDNTRVFASIPSHHDV